MIFNGEAVENERVMARVREIARQNHLMGKLAVVSCFNNPAGVAESGGIWPSQAPRRLVFRGRTLVRPDLCELDFIPATFVKLREDPQTGKMKPVPPEEAFEIVVEADRE